MLYPTRSDICGRMGTHGPARGGMCLMFRECPYPTWVSIILLDARISKRICLLLGCLMLPLPRLALYWSPRDDYVRYYIGPNIRFWLGSNRLNPCPLKFVGAREHCHFWPREIMQSRSRHNNQNFRFWDQNQRAHRQNEPWLMFLVKLTMSYLSD